MSAQKREGREYADKGAQISPCGRYRFRLWREWRGIATKSNWRWIGGKDGAGEEIGEPKSCLFVMLNPSTADGEKDDPTIRRCVDFAKREKYDLLEVINLFPLRATDPKEVLKFGGTTDDLFPPQHQDIVERCAVRAGVIIAAWGAHGGHCDQDETMLGWLTGYDVPIKCLGLTKDGFPRHPLYVKRDAPLIEYEGRAALAGGRS